MADKFDWVHTFEPDPDNFEALCKNIEDVENIAAYHAALGSEAGTGSMDHIDPSNIGAHQVQDGNDFDIVILDDFVLEDVDLVQLDIEGFEHFALMGGHRTIDANSPVIVLELKATQINGIFDNEYALIDAGGGVGVASREPKFQTETINVPNAADGDTLVVESITYKVRVVEPDGTGTTTLMLEKQ